MNIKVKAKYLVFPVNTLSSNKKMTFFCDGKEEYTLNIRLDNFSPDFYAYIDVSRYMGSILSVAIEPEMDISFEESDKMEISSLYEESYRPQVHFTTKNGYINDPNGLIYVDGLYHLFYQYNPCENKGNNKHWGHAVSKDLIHWEERDIALFPDRTGEMFSGSAIVDEKNLLGLQDGKETTVLLYYTATNAFDQRLAYSTDKLNTVTKYSEKPIVPNIVGLNRDPKVIFCEEWNSYAMALYLEKNVYSILKSDNLIDWILVQKFELPGSYECPDLFPIIADNGSRKWVFMGANDRYIVGDMVADGFEPTQEVQSLHYGKSAYAGQSFSGMPNGRIIRIDWDKWRIPTPKINGQMSFPTELSLKEIQGTYYVCANPIKEIESIYDQSEVIEKCSVYANHSEKIWLMQAPYLIKMNFNAKELTHLALKIFGIDVFLDKEENGIKISDTSAPVTFDSENWDITIIVDRCSLECYLDGGKIYLGTVDQRTYCDYNLPYLEITSTTAYMIDKIELHSLKSIWKRG